MFEKDGKLVTTQWFRKFKSMAYFHSLCYLVTKYNGFSLNCVFVFIFVSILHLEQ
jgi:hypothetical protein